MKKIEAVIRQSRLPDVIDALVHAGVTGMTFTEVSGRGRNEGTVLNYRGVTMQKRFVPNVKIEIIAAHHEVEHVVDTIFQSAHTGQVGDGRIVVTQIESVVRIRTGEVEESEVEFDRHRPAEHSGSR